MTLQLVSWNVLADAYIRPKFYPRVEPAVLRPGARTAGIIDVIAGGGADIVCLQEAEVPLIDACRAQLASLGWAIHYASKRDKPDGCAILARPGVGLESVRELVYADGAPDRDDSGHIALLASAVAAGHRVEIATTHLRWDPPGTPADARWAVRQATELLRLTRDRSSPWIVCGDLNLEADDPVYAMFADAGFVDPSAGALHPTANPNGRAKRIDHILHTAGLRVTALPMLAIDDATPLPSPTMPSDHVPIAVAVDPAAGREA